MLVKHYLFEDEKYEVQRNTTTYDMQIYRNGMRWSTMEVEMQHCKFFHAVLNRIDELEESNG